MISTNMSGSAVMDIFKKFNLKIINNKRYYEFDFSNKIYSCELENTIPYLFKYGDLIVQTSKWNQLAVQIVTYLYEKNPKTDEELLSIRYDFSNTPVFSKEKKTNFSSFKHLFLNTNHSAGHAFRSIQTILSFFGVNLSECYFLIRRHINVEPTDVKTYFREITILQYRNFLKFKGFKEEKILILLKNIDKLNLYLNKMKTAFNDFYLFDDYYYFTNYKSKFLEYLNEKYSSNEKFLKASEINLKYLDSFYRNRPVIEKINTIDIDAFKEILIQEAASLFNSLNSFVISSHKLYSIMRLKYREEMSKLDELNNQDYFFQICEVLLSREYIFEKPFISKSKGISLTNDELMIRYAYSQEKITVPMLRKYADKMHFKRVDNMLTFFVEISDQYVQVDVDTLINKDSLDINDEVISKIKDEIMFYIKSFGSVYTSKYVGYDVLPSINIKWNKYLLIGLIRTFLNNDFEIEYTNNAYNRTDFIIKIRL